jgi:hypothetical protein
MNAKLGIKEVCLRFGLSEVYVRRSISKGSLKTTKVRIEGHESGYKHLIDEDEVIRWRSESGHNKRDDGRNRFLLYATPEEFGDLESLIKESGLGVIVFRQNPPKSESTED